MAIERTAQNLATFCLQVVGTPYWMGTFGQKASRNLYNEKKAQYSKYYPPKSWTEASFVDDFGKHVTDCAGLIKWFLWSDNMTNKNPSYKASEDFGATTFYNKCTEKGKINTLPKEQIGICVFNGDNTTKTHVGVIVDNNGTVVEAKGHAYGTIKSKASQWDYWGKCHLIKYVTEPEPTPQPTPTPEPATVKTYRVVNIRTFLAIRNTPYADPSDKNKVGELYNGALVSVFETRNNWAKIGSGMWVSMTYLNPV